MEFTAAEFEKAVAQFYHADANLQAKAHQWLTAAQTTPEAWTFVWELLEPNKSTELQFFAATTLHTKVIKWWKEVPEDQYPVLKTKLLEAIINYCLGPKIVLNRLCITLSAYVLQTIPAHWPNAIAELLRTLQPSSLPAVPAERTAWILLEILTVLPEEFQSSHLSQNQKVLIRNELQRNIPQVLALLEEVLATNNSNLINESSWEVTHQALRCAGSWLQLGVLLTDCLRLADLLVTVIVNSMNLTHHHHLANVPEAAFEALSAMATHPDTHKYPQSCLQLINKILQLHPLFQQVSTDDQELMSNMYCMFISVAECHSQLLITSLQSDGPEKNTALQIIQVILHCTNTPGIYPIEETLSQHSLGFWYILQDELRADTANLDVLMKSLKPVYRILAEVILHKSMLPADESSWSSDEKELLRCYRQDVADTMMYCYNVLHEELLNLLLQKLEAALLEVNTNIKTNSSNVVNRCPEGWRLLESVFHSFVAVAECIDIHEEAHVPRFISVLEHLPFAHLNIRVINSALNVIGSCAEWINSNPSSMGHVIPLLVTGIKSSEVAPAATMALKDLTRECLTTIHPYSQHILQASRDVLAERILQPGECIRLMFTVGRLVSVLPLDTAVQYLNSTIIPYIDELGRLIEQQELNSSIRSVIMLRLKMLGVIFGTLQVRSVITTECDDKEGTRICEHVLSDPVQPVFCLLQRILPTAQTIALRMENDSEIVQAVFTLMKHGVSTLLDACEPFLPELLTLITRTYERKPHPAALDFAVQIITLFGGEEAQVSVMQSFLTVLCKYTMQHFFFGANLSEHVDVLESFFKLLTQVLRKRASLFTAFENNDCSALFQAGTVTISVPEVPAVKAATSFLVNFITQSREIPPLLGVVQICGEGLVIQVLRCIGGEAPRAALDPLSDILLVLNKKYCDNLSRWLNQAMQQEGFPSSRMSAEAKEHFVRMVLKERANKRKLQDVVREFALACRGLINVYPAAQTTQYF